MTTCDVELMIRLAPKDEPKRVVLEMHSDWAPLGVERFLTLVKEGFYSDARWHRVIPGFIAQVGIAGDPKVYEKWGYTPIKDDKVAVSNTRGTVSFAMKGPNTRSCQIFVNLVNNESLDGQGFSPIAKVKEGMDVIDKLVEVPSGPDQNKYKELGNAYMDANFPHLSTIVSAKAL
mmetsp:Transcript_17800/g.32228  ORF Transcript_17800/g.32228 Transcript_17800/m.32228 type:complete len:175 (+) Transcript_17800:72-596(+)